jgi:hypothetical protein
VNFSHRLGAARRIRRRELACATVKTAGNHGGIGAMAQFNAVPKI